jgi:hypothetical protein
MYQANGCYFKQGLHFVFKKMKFGMKYFIIFMKNAYDCLNKLKKMLIIVIYTIYKFLKVCKFLANLMFHFYKFS